jgi:hypothetical protein
MKGMMREAISFKIENLQIRKPRDMRLIDLQLQFSAAERFCLAPPIARATIHSDLAVLRAA